MLEDAARRASDVRGGRRPWNRHIFRDARSFGGRSPRRRSAFSVRRRHGQRQQQVGDLDRIARGQLRGRPRHVPVTSRRSVHASAAPRARQRRHYERAQGALLERPVGDASRAVRAFATAGRRAPIPLPGPPRFISYVQLEYRSVPKSQGPRDGGSLGAASRRRRPSASAGAGKLTADICWIFAARAALTSHLPKWEAPMTEDLANSKAAKPVIRWRRSRTAGARRG